MPRKRKIPVHVSDDENDENIDVLGVSRNQQHGPMYTIMSNAQLNETFHNKYTKEMQQLYLKMDHDAFMFTFIKMIKSAMAAEESSEYANTTLVFCAKFVASYDGEDTHLVLTSIFKWLLSTISNNPHIRFRLCQFVNMVLNALGLEAALDDTICDNILSYMVDRLRDLNPNVRVQAILALQRLQIPDNPDDVVVKTYLFHLSSDPSPRVRQAVITSIGRNFNTIPYILERLWDVDEKVRRHTYLHMSSYPVRAYKVSQRLMFLEQGLNDRSDMVRKVVSTIMLPQWLEVYNKNVILLISGLKLDANEAEIDRFRKITKITLHAIFKRQNIEDLVKTLPLEEEGDCYRCVPFEKLTIEVSLYWLCLIEYLQNENADELDSVIPELTTFCNYVQKFCESSNPDADKWKKMEYQYVLLTLMEIVNTFDLGDEIGRENLRNLLENLLKNFNIEEHTIKVIVQCTENLITKQEDRLQFFVDIIKELSDAKSLINELSHDRTLIAELIEKHPDRKDLKFQISSLKVKMLDLEEQETNFVRKKDYSQAQRITEELNACREEFMNLLKPILNQVSSSDSEESSKFMSLTLEQKKISPETLVKSLQISFYMVVSKKVKSLTRNVCDLYTDFIRRHVESNQIGVRDWALKCGTAYSMLYEPLSKDVYNELYSQFYKNHSIRLWKTAIECIFELLDRYGCSHFEIEEKHNKSRKTGRQLYNKLDLIDAEEETSTTSVYEVDLIFMMSHFLDTCNDSRILSALVNGFCRLVLHGHIKNDDIIEKLLLKYFNPTTDSEINQIMGVFFENLIKKKKQQYLQPCLLPTISTIMSAPYDSPLHEIKPETVLRFVIDSTRPIYCSTGLNIHNTIALSFLQEMQSKISNKDLLRILAKELVTLEVSFTVDSPMQNDITTSIDKLKQCDIDPNTAKYLTNFRDILDGTYNTRNITEHASDGQVHEDSSNSDEEIPASPRAIEAQAVRPRRRSIDENRKDTQLQELPTEKPNKVAEKENEKMQETLTHQDSPNESCPEEHKPNETNPEEHSPTKTSPEIHNSISSAQSNDISPQNPAKKLEKTVETTKIAAGTQQDESRKRSRLDTCDTPSTRPAPAKKVNDTSKAKLTITRPITRTQQSELLRGRYRPESKRFNNSATRTPDKKTDETEKEKGQSTGRPRGRPRKNENPPSEPHQASRSLGSHSQSRTRTSVEQFINNSKENVNTTRKTRDESENRSRTEARKAYPTTPVTRMSSRSQTQSAPRTRSANRSASGRLIINSAKMKSLMTTRLKSKK